MTKPSTIGNYNGSVSFSFTKTGTGKQKKHGREYAVYGQCGQMNRAIYGRGPTLQIAWDHFKLRVRDIVLSERANGFRVFKQGSRTVTVSGKGW